MHTLRPELEKRATQRSRATWECRRANGIRLSAQKRGARIPRSACNGAAAPHALIRRRACGRVVAAAPPADAPGQHGRVLVAAGGRGPLCVWREAGHQRRHSGGRRGEARLAQSGAPNQHSAPAEAGVSETCLAAARLASCPRLGPAAAPTATAPSAPPRPLSDPSPRSSPTAARRRRCSARCSGAPRRVTSPASMSWATCWGAEHSASPGWRPISRRCGPAAAGAGAGAGAGSRGRDQGGRRRGGRGPRHTRSLPAGGNALRPRHRRPASGGLRRRPTPRPRRLPGAGRARPACIGARGLAPCPPLLARCRRGWAQCALTRRPLCGRPSVCVLRASLSRASQC